MIIHISFPYHSVTETVINIDLTVLHRLMNMTIQVENLKHDPCSLSQLTHTYSKSKRYMHY